MEIIDAFPGKWGPVKSVVFCCIALETYNSQEYQKLQFIFLFKQQEKQSKCINMK